MEQNIIGLLNPLIAMTFSLAFLGFWLVQKHHGYILAISLGYLTFSLGMFISNIGIAAENLLHVLGTHLLYSMAVMSLTWAVCSRAGEPAYTWLTLSLAICVTPILIWIHNNSGLANLRIILANATYCVILFVGARGLWKNRLKHSADYWLFIIFLLAALQFLIRPSATLALEGNLLNAEYLDSIYYSTLNLTMAFLALMLALSLLAVCVLDYIRDIPRKGTRAVAKKHHFSEDDEKIGSLKKLMESNIHKQHDLSIGMLSEVVEIPEYQLSTMINQTMGYKNFREFINSYRLKEVQAALSNQTFDCTPITTIAFDSGFNSIPSFNRVFKAEFGIAPSTYRDQQIAKRQS